MKTTTRSNKAKKISKGWEAVRPVKKLSDLTLEQFKAQHDAAEKADGDVTKLESQLKNARTRNADLWRELSKTGTMIANAVKGDPTEGPDGDLIQAMGYKKNSEKKKPVRRAKTAKEKAA